MPEVNIVIRVACNGVGLIVVLVVVLVLVLVQVQATVLLLQPLHLPLLQHQWYTNQCIIFISTINIVDTKRKRKTTQRFGAEQNQADVVTRDIRAVGSSRYRGLVPVQHIEEVPSPFFFFYQVDEFQKETEDFDFATVKNGMTSAEDLFSSSLERNEFKTIPLPPSNPLPVVEEFTPSVNLLK